LLQNKKTNISLSYGQPNKNKINQAIQLGSSSTHPLSFLLKGSKKGTWLNQHHLCYYFYLVFIGSLAV
jgi:hypothetical protein